MVIGCLKTEMNQIKENPMQVLVYHVYIVLLQYNIRSIMVARGRRSRDLMLVGFTTKCAISAYHY